LFETRIDDCSRSEDELELITNNYRPSAVSRSCEKRPVHRRLRHATALTYDKVPLIQPEHRDTINRIIDCAQSTMAAVQSSAAIETPEIEHSTSPATEHDQQQTYAQQQTQTYAPPPSYPPPQPIIVRGYRTTTHQNPLPPPYYHHPQYEAAYMEEEENGLLSFSPSKATALLTIGGILGLSAAAAVRWLNGGDFQLFPHPAIHAAATTRTKCDAD
jgi:hypothetical protein